MFDISAQIEIVEIMANPEGKDFGEEYVVIKNISNEKISLDNLYLDDKEGENSPYALNGILIQPLGEVTLKSSQTKISINNKNDQIRILDENFNSIIEIPIPKSYEGLAWSNKSGSPPTITEIFPNPEGTDKEFEWIEIYNASSTAIDLSGYFLDDGEEGNEPYALSGILYPSEYKIITDSESGITLNNTADEIRIISEDDEVEKISYEDAREDKSFAKTENDWQWTLPTKGAANITHEEPTDPEAQTSAIIEIENTKENKKLTDLLPYFASALIIGTLTAYEKIVKK